jgi:hypothetical protein
MFQVIFSPLLFSRTSVLSYHTNFVHLQNYKIRNLI